MLACFCSNWRVTGAKGQDTPGSAHRAQERVRNSSSSVSWDPGCVKGTNGHKGDHDCCQIMNALKVMVRKAKAKEQQNKKLKRTKILNVTS